MDKVNIFTKNSSESHISIFLKINRKFWKTLRSKARKITEKTFNAKGENLITVTTRLQLKVGND